MSPRKRGAQPGNLNALRHGFYSRTLRQQELDDLDLVEWSDLTGEVAILRVGIRRLLEFAETAADLDTAMNVLDLLGSSCARLSGLIYRFKSLSGGRDQDFAQSLSQALDRAIKDMKLK